jgi:lipoprotein-anchoring transpeptidase ErfK/SrfK
MTPRSLGSLLCVVVVSVLAVSCGGSTAAESATTPTAEPTLTSPTSQLSAPSSPANEATEQLPDIDQEANRQLSTTDIVAGFEAMVPFEPGTLVAHAVGDEVVARQSPSVDAPAVSSFVNPTAVGGPLVFQAVGPVVDGWIEVLLPVRPNGTTGWVDAGQVSLTINPYRIEVDVSRFELTVFRYGVEQVRTDVGIGVGDTPTPIGEFYLMELLRPANPDGAYGPFAYGLSGFSNSLDSFNGGEGVIGIHGTNRPELLGQQVSHGCVRVDNDTIAALTEFLPLGTPVVIFDSDAESAGSTPEAIPTDSRRDQEPVTFT